MALLYTEMMDLWKTNKSRLKFSLSGLNIHNMYLISNANRQVNLKKKTPPSPQCLLGRSCSSFDGNVDLIPHQMKLTRADKVIKWPLRWQPGLNREEVDVKRKKTRKIQYYDAGKV